MPQARSTAVAGNGTPERIDASRLRYWALVAFLALVFAMGGGARSDITSLIVLRPLSVLMLGFAAALAGRANLKRLGVPFYLLLALAALIAIQLIPLPPDIWRSLPGRALVARLTDDAGLAGTWRPLALSPSAAVNALLSLFVPMAGFMLWSIQPDLPVRRLAWALIIVGVINAMVGLLQIIGSPYGPLYLYSITNNGVAVGLFANRNHNAIFLASLIPLLGYVAMQARPGRNGDRKDVAIAGGALAAALFFIPLILVSGSRAGTVLGFAAVLLTGALLWIEQWLGARGTGRAAGFVARYAGVAFVLAVSGMALITYALSRSLAFERFLNGSIEGNMRAQVLPQLWNLAQTYFPAGSGFGSFYLVYEVSEPLGLLQENYLNQAHNDPLQAVIECGLPALLIMLALAAWFLVSGWKAARRFAQRQVRGAPPGIALFAWASLGILFAGSALDYPLRTPSLMLTAALLCCLIEAGLRADLSRANARRG